MHQHPGPRAATRFAGRRLSSRAFRAAAVLLLAAAGVILAPAPDAAAQSLPPRLVVFEGFYNPG
jgi:hypothetical protein